MSTDAIVEILKNPWFWFAVLGAAIGLVGYLIYPQTNTHTDYTQIANDYTSGNVSDVLDVIVFQQDHNKALAEMALKYPDYTIIEEAYLESKKAWFFRIVKRKEGEK